MKNLKYNFGLKLRFYPSNRQKRMVKKSSDAARVIYNHSVGLHQKKWYLKHTPTWNPTVYQAVLKRLKPAYKISWIRKRYGFLNDSFIDSFALVNANRNYQIAWTNYKHGFQHIPSFHALRRHPYEEKYQTSCCFNKTKHGLWSSIKFLDRRHLKINKLGMIKISKVRDLVWSKRNHMRIGTVTVRKDSANHYSVSLQLASETPFVRPLPCKNRTCGYDLNINNFAQLSNGDRVDNPCYYKKARHRLKTLDRIIARRRRHNHGRNLRYCSNYQKVRLKRAALLCHVKNQRTDFLNNISKKMIENYDWIFGENLKIRSMFHNHSYMVPSILSMGWREFITMLKRKAQIYGKHIVLINPKYTTQICHNCGFNMDNHGRKIQLGVETWRCPRCHRWHCRDLNAARNILSRGVQQTYFKYYIMLKALFRMPSCEKWPGYFILTDVSRQIAAD